MTDRDRSASDPADFDAHREKDDVRAQAASTDSSPGSKGLSQLIFRPAQQPDSSGSAEVTMDRPGQVIEPATRSSMETSLGRDLGDVRVHTDDDAGRSAERIGAHAYTFGRHIAFAKGRYSPGTAVGQRLLAHEVAHVVQQREGGAPPQLDSSAPHEVEAERVAGAIGSGQMNVQIEASTGTGVARSNGGGGAAARKPALTKQDMFGIIQKQTAWEFNRGGAPKEDPAGVGRGVGPAAGGRRAGFTVFTVIQILDRDSNQVELSLGEHLRYGDPHAEQSAMQTLSRNLEGVDVSGGRMQVMVTQTPCAPGEANCMGDLVDFARERGMALEVDVPARPPQSGTGPSVRPRTATRGSQRTDMPEVTFERIVDKAAPSRGPAGGGSPPAAPAAKPAETPPEKTVEKVPEVERAQMEFTTKGNVIYTDPNEPVTPHSSISDPYGHPPPPIGAGLFEAGAIWLPAAMNALQDLSLRDNVAHQMLGHWSELEAWRKENPQVWIVTSVTLDEWDIPDPAGNVVRQVVEVAFYRGATQAEAWTASRGPSLGRVAPRGFHLVGPFTAVIPPEADLAKLKAGVAKEKTCFIATTCYGSPLAPEVVLLRGFRDRVLAKHVAGRIFIGGYYAVSPEIAHLLERHETARVLVRDWILRPIVKAIEALYAWRPAEL
jgi:uncharacterized protein DUF4157